MHSSTLLADGCQISRKSVLRNTWIIHYTKVTTHQRCLRENGLLATTCDVLKPWLHTSSWGRASVSSAVSSSWGRPRTSWGRDASPSSSWRAGPWACTSCLGRTSSDSPSGSGWWPSWLARSTCARCDWNDKGTTSIEKQDHNIHHCKKKSKTTFMIRSIKLKKSKTTWQGDGQNE